jgi:transcription termination factor Rho
LKASKNNEEFLVNMEEDMKRKGTNKRV